MSVSNCASSGCLGSFSRWRYSLNALRDDLGRILIASQSKH